MKLGYGSGYPNFKRFRRRTRLEAAGLQAEQLKVLTGSMQSVVSLLSVYADPRNWRETGDTKDVQNEAGLVVGVEKICTWVGPGEGPQLATMGLRKLLGVKEKEDGNEQK